MLKFFLVAFFFLPLVAHADNGTEKLLSYLKPLQTLSADFHQSTINQQGRRLLESDGHMLVARGNKFRWQTTKPDHRLVVTDGTTVWVYDPGLLQVVIKPLKAKLTATPALLFGGSLDSVKKAFNVTYKRYSDSRIRFILEPKDEQAMFSELDVSFHNKMPVSMRLVDSLGQKTLIDFDKVKVNPEIDAAKFQFTPPDDVDVIRRKPVQ